MTLCERVCALATLSSSHGSPAGPSPARQTLCCVRIDIWQARRPPAARNAAAVCAATATATAAAASASTSVVPLPGLPAPGRETNLFRVFLCPVHSQSRKPRQPRPARQLPPATQSIQSPLSAARVSPVSLSPALLCPLQSSLRRKQQPVSRHHHAPAPRASRSLTRAFYSPRAHSRPGLSSPVLPKRHCRIATTVKTQVFPQPSFCRRPRPSAPSKAQSHTRTR